MLQRFNTPACQLLVTEPQTPFRSIKKSLFFITNQAGERGEGGESIVKRNLKKVNSLSSPKIDRLRADAGLL